MNLQEKKEKAATQLEMQDLAHVDELKTVRRDRASIVARLLS